MAGLNNILDHIKKDSDEKANAILKEAQDYADTLMADAKKRADLEIERINKKCESELQNIAERSISSCALKKKQKSLVVKENIIMETIEKAKEKLINLPDVEYGELFIKVLEKNIPAKECTMKLGKRDLDRLNFFESLGIVAVAATKGAKLTISDKPADIKSGFILDFGGVEGNCSFEALVDQNMDVLIDKVNTILFA